MADSKVWLITGASRGIGLALARRVVEAHAAARFGRDGLRLGLMPGPPAAPMLRPGGLR